MRKYFFALAFLLLGTYAFANSEVLADNLKIEIKTEISENGNVSISTFYLDEFDVCTVTVTITRSDGVVARGRATSSTGDCAAAADAAEASARAKLAEAGFQ